MSLFKSTEYKLSGLNITRLLNFLVERGVVLKNLRYAEENVVFFKIEVCHEKILTEAVASTRLSLERVRSSRASVLKANVILLTAVFTVVCILGFLTSFLFQIKVEGVSGAARTEILTELKGFGIKPGMLKKSVNLSNTEVRLKTNVESLALVSLSFKGSSLIVNAREKIKDAAEFQPTLQNITAPIQGVVESINIISGTAKVKKGDLVTAGNILIEAAVQRSGQILPIAAIGEVKIATTHIETIEFSEKKVILVRSGRKSTQKYWTFLGRTVKIKNKKSGFKNFEVEHKAKNTALFPLLPFKLFETHVYELKQQEVTESFLAKREALKAEAIVRARAEVGSNYKILGEYTTEKQVGEGVYQVAGYIQYEVVVR